MQRRVFMGGGRALKGLGGIPVYQTLSNSEYRPTERGSETAGDKLRRQKGNNPDRQLRSLSTAQSIRTSRYYDSQDVGLEAAII